MAEDYTNHANQAALRRAQGLPAAGWLDQPSQGPSLDKLRQSNEGYQNIISGGLSTDYLMRQYFLRATKNELAQHEKLKKLKTTIGEGKYEQLKNERRHHKLKDKIEALLGRQQLPHSNEINAQINSGGGAGEGAGWGWSYNPSNDDAN